MKNIHRMLPGIWLLAAVALGAWSIWDSLSGATSWGVLGFSVLAALGSLLMFRGLWAGAALLQVAAAVALLYAGVYGMFGGWEDRGLAYTASVLLLAILGAGTFGLFWIESGAPADGPAAPPRG